jgi:hypothetical protein
MFRNFIIFQHLSLFETPTGMSDLRAAYGSFWMLDTVRQLRNIALERYSLPMMVGEYDHPDRRADLEQSLETARSQTWMSLPIGCQVKALDIAGRGPSDFENAIASLKEDIAIAISGAFLQMLAGDIPNGAGNSQVHKSTSELLQWELASKCGDLLTDQVAPDLIAKNFSEADIPKVTFGGTNDANLLPSVQIDSALSQTLGLDLSLEELYKRYARQKPRTPQDTLQSPINYQKQQQQIMQMQQQQQMQIQAQQGGPDKAETTPTDQPDGGQEDGNTPGNTNMDQTQPQEQQFAEMDTTYSGHCSPIAEGLGFNREKMDPDGVRREREQIRTAERLQGGATRTGPPSDPWQKSGRFAEHPGIISKVTHAPAELGNLVKKAYRWATKRYGKVGAPLVLAASTVSPLPGLVPVAAEAIRGTVRKLEGKSFFAEGSPPIDDRMLDHLRQIHDGFHAAAGQQAPFVSRSKLKAHLLCVMKNPKKFTDRLSKFSQAGTVSALSQPPKRLFSDDGTDVDPGLGQEPAAYVRKHSEQKVVVKDKSSGQKLIVKDNVSAFLTHLAGSLRGMQPWQLRELTAAAERMAAEAAAA